MVFLKYDMNNIIIFKKNIKIRRKTNIYKPKYFISIKLLYTYYFYQ